MCVCVCVCVCCVCVCVCNVNLCPDISQQTGRYFQKISISIGKTYIVIYTYIVLYTYKE